MSAKSANSGMSSSKSAMTALLLCLILGIFGAHRFYVGKTKSAVLMLLTLGGLGFWMLADLTLIACGEFKDSDGRVLTFPRTDSSAQSIFRIIVMVIGLIALYAALIGLPILYATSGLTGIIQNELIALRAGDIEKAYSYTSPDFQNITSYEDFKNFIDQVPALKDNKSASFSGIKVVNDKGLVSGTVIGNDGTSTPVEFLLIREGKVWKIEGISINPASPDAAASDESANTDTNTDTNANTDNSGQASEEDKSSENDTATKPDGKMPDKLTYQDNSAKYTIQYPGDWYYEQPDKISVLFSGKKGSPSYYTTVTIQTLPMKKAGGIYNNVKEIIADLKNQINTKTTNVKYISEGAAKLPQNPKDYTGQYFEVSYTYKGENMQKLQYVLMRPDGSAAYSWGYTTPADRYDTDLSNAQAMYDSWVIK